MCGSALKRGGTHLQSSLHIASRMGKAVILPKLLSNAHLAFLKKRKAQKKEGEGVGAVHIVDVVAAEVDMLRDCHGLTPLHHAAISDCREAREVVRLLLDDEHVKHCMEAKV